MASPALSLVSFLLNSGFDIDLVKPLECEKVSFSSKFKSDAGFVSSTESKMVKRSKKSKSKRVSLKQKYKVVRKVKEHHKKKAKEAKKLGLNRKPKVEKDPGIPNDWPFKEQELKALEARRARVLEDLEQKKAARKERAKKRKLGLLEDDDDISKLADIASAKEQNFGKGKKSDVSTAIGTIRDNSERAFYKELVKVIEASDVILEVLDARDPLGTRCIDMERMYREKLLKNGSSILGRSYQQLPLSAAPRSKGQTWVGSLPRRPKKQAISCKLVTVLIKKSITVGIIGLPNVGKSSLINSLKRCQVVNVGATPGLTRSLQEVHLDKNIKLLDCPGVVMLKSGENEASVALRNCKKIEKLEDPIGPVKEILKLCPERMLVTLYKLPSFDSVDDFLQKVATVRGKLKREVLWMSKAAARIVLHDWNEGKIPYYTMPPTRNQDEPTEAKIVSELGKEFNIDEVYSNESSFIGSLKSFDDVKHVEVPPNCPLTFDEQMVEDNIQPEPSTQSYSQVNDTTDNGRR
ncbi:hypothetical protein HYC85_031473 [Camellia sinensis]|uniref:CP-type G domain-containing protein n=1 Tax=Camellia sinensis TaxID=4442 RepID=A0A7J7FQN3_CAMSI|nr:hypothetical protein HYC85_031473 [Camellia sinensis]